MVSRNHCLTIIMLTIFVALPAWGQQYLLYTPQPVTSGQKESSKDGVLVQEVEIKRGDTLRDLSRKFSGHETYYPQILLFNTIKNPNRIYVGNTLRIPVSHINEIDAEKTESKPTGSSRSAIEPKEKNSSVKAEIKQSVLKPAAVSPGPAPSTETSLSDSKTAGENKTRKKYRTKTSVAHKKINPSDSSSTSSKVPSTSKHTASSATSDSKGQVLFEAAVKAYRKNDCRAALELLDRFLAEYSSSSHSSDAYLYKADCYLKLSAQ
jgi:TolA-binding protein